MADSSPWRFQRWAFETRTGHPTRKAVLSYLAMSADAETGRCEAKQAKIAKGVEASERSVRGHLAELERQGLIARRPQYRIDRGRRSDEYLLLAPDVTEWPDGQPVGYPPEDPAGGYPGGVPESPHPPATGCRGPRQPTSGAPGNGLPRKNSHKNSQENEVVVEGAREASDPAPTSSGSWTPPGIDAAVWAKVREALDHAGFDAFAQDAQAAPIEHAVRSARLPADVDWWAFGRAMLEARENGTCRAGDRPASVFKFVANRPGGPPRLGVTEPNHGSQRHRGGRRDHSMLDVVAELEARERAAGHSDPGGGVVDGEAEEL
ncbi:winged helix-turn-helix domain-containing protein [Patulibacter defluvii]|uniref:winged helix-turn-helix domain-containing protein n=1 Tax=Patulibacter defluvii TaxID=3095358 RepID=UPI002A748391|nr:winged helix-turn-helix domain-containing protein [Patulibacter sp. DM4]